VTEPDSPVPPMAHSEQAQRSAVANVRAGRSPFVPLLLVALALVGALAFQAVQLARDRQQLSIAQANLQPQEQAAKKVRASLDALATATAKLAADGNVNAGAIVEELRRRGITIRTPGTP
jgi:hypothetical protein